MKKLSLLLISAIVASCQSPSAKNEQPKDSVVQAPVKQAEVKVPQLEPIYISTYTTYKEKDGGMGMKTEVSKVNTAYFEMDLMSMSRDKTNIASKELVPVTNYDTYHGVSVKITDEKSAPIFFDTSTDFLNFMDAHGYEMKDQQKRRFGISYTFKKK
jgi:hypothetical protein